MIVTKSLWIGVGGVILIGVGVFLWKTSSSETKIEVIKPSVVAEKSLAVDVSGAVNNPGVYKFAQEMRMGEVIASAGGITADADTNWIETSLNMASKVIDGQKIFIPRAAPLRSEGATLGVKQNSSININTASESDLDTLPGVGPVTAGKIMAGRPYQRLEELTEKKIVTAKR